MERNQVRNYVNQYCKLRDDQYSAYEMCARKHNLTVNELFVLDIIYFAPEGCLQIDICKRLSMSKQTASAIIKKFLKQGYLTLIESKSDRRNKIIHFTKAGKEYTEKIIPPIANKEIDAMARLSDEDIAELVRLTSLFSNYMQEEFKKVVEETK